MLKIKNRAENFKKKMDKNLNRLKKEAQKEIQELFSAVFEENERLVSFSFTCYTPYFNDGEECRYQVHFYGEMEDLEFKEHASDEEKEKALDDLLKIFNAIPDEYFEDIYGDHCEVKVTKERTEVSDYDHD